MSRRAIFLTVMGGSAAWWAALNLGLPISAVDPEKNIALLKTKGGNTVAATQASSTWAWAGAAAARAARLPARALRRARWLFVVSSGWPRACRRACSGPAAECAPRFRHLPASPTQDAAGRVFMWDRAGNIYYDTEDPRTGLYIVSDACWPPGALLLPGLGQLARLAAPRAGAQAPAPLAAPPGCARRRLRCTEPRLAPPQVDTAGDMYNSFVDKDGKVGACFT